MTPPVLRLEEYRQLGTKCVNDIRDLLEVSQPNVSQHLAVLKENGLVAARKNGASRCYYLARPRLVKDLFATFARDDAGPARKDVRGPCRNRRRTSRQAPGRGRAPGGSRAR